MLFRSDDEARKDSYQRPAGRDHDQDPEVELLVWPEIRLTNDDGSVSLDTRPRDGAHAGSACRRHGGGCEGPRASIQCASMYARVITEADVFVQPRGSMPIERYHCRRESRSCVPMVRRVLFRPFYSSNNLGGMSLYMRSRAQCSAAQPAGVRSDVSAQCAGSTRWRRFEVGLHSRQIGRRGRTNAGTDGER